MRKIIFVILSTLLLTMIFFFPVEAVRIENKNVVSDDSCNEKDTVFNPLLKIKGRVIDTNGKPVDGAQLEFIIWEEILPRHLFATSNANGYYTRHLTDDFTFGHYENKYMRIKGSRDGYKTKNVYMYIGPWNDGDEMEAPTVIMKPLKSQDKSSLPLIWHFPFFHRFINILN